jgi:hypothetical protein
MNLIVRTIRYLSWTFRRYRQFRLLPSHVREEIQRLEAKPFSVGCPLCDKKFENGRSFRWHLVGHDS